MKNSTIRATIALGGFMLVAALAIALKLRGNPAVEPAISQISADRLQQAPDHLTLLRPSRFPDTPGRIKHLRNGETLARTAGRNVTFRDLIAEAYGCPPGCVVLPHPAPAGGYDFLVTVTPETRKQLRSAIERQLGYTAGPTTQDTEVLVLQVKDPGLPGLAVSTASDSNIGHRDGKLLFTHQPVAVIIKGLEDGLGMPILDQTGLTNYYDFALPWSDGTTKAMRHGQFPLEGVQKVLAAWGLELKPARASVELFTVAKTR